MTEQVVGPITVNFDLTAEAADTLMLSRSQSIRDYIQAAATMAAGVVCLVVGIVASLGVFGVLLIIAGVVLVLFGAGEALLLTQVPKQFRTQSARIAGPIQVEFSERGVTYKGDKIDEHIEWTRVRTLADRPMAWVMVTRPSSGIYLVPKTAVPAAEAAQLTSALKAWAGKRYKLRRR